MPDIKLVIRVTNDELECLRLGQCDKPNPERVKQMLLAAARSNVRNVFARVDESRAAKYKAERDGERSSPLRSGERSSPAREAKLHAGKSKRVPKANGIIKWDNHPVEG